MIAFCLSNPISQEEIINKIKKLIEKEIKNKEQADKSLLVIKICEITDVENIKKLTVD